MRRPRVAAVCGARGVRGFRSCSWPSGPSFSVVMILHQGCRGDGPRRAEEPGRDLDCERPPQRAFRDRQVLAGGVDADVGTPTGRPPRRVERDRPTRRPHHAEQLALRAWRPAGDAGPGGVLPRWQDAAGPPRYGVTSAVEATAGASASVGVSDGTGSATAEGTAKGGSGAGAAASGACASLRISIPQSVIFAAR